MITTGASAILQVLHFFFLCRIRAVAVIYLVEGQLSRMSECSHYVVCNEEMLACCPAAAASYSLERVLSFYKYICNAELYPQEAAYTLVAQSRIY